MKSSSVFNSPVELGLRALMLLAESHPKPLDIQRLVILDYLLVHSGDLEGGPESLHPPSPLRAGEENYFSLSCRGSSSNPVPEYDHYKIQVVDASAL